MTCFTTSPWYMQLNTQITEFTGSLEKLTVPELIINIVGLQGGILNIATACGKFPCAFPAGFQETAFSVWLRCFCNCLHKLNMKYQGQIFFQKAKENNLPFCCMRKHKNNSSISQLPFLSLALRGITLCGRKHWNSAYLRECENYGMQQSQPKRGGNKFNLIPKARLPPFILFSRYPAQAAVAAAQFPEKKKNLGT